MIRKITLIGLITVGMALGIANVSAQTTIGTEVDPVEGALLDLKHELSEISISTATKGVVLPRVELQNKASLLPLVATETAALKASHIGTVVYNLKKVASTSDYAALKEKALYIWDGTEWRLLGEGTSLKYFYMPPFNLPLGASGVSKTVNLFTEYTRQFTYNATNNPQFITSKGANYNLPGKYTNAYDFHYVVVDHSNDITVTSITAAGVMTYSATNSAISDDSYINIILVIRD